MKLILIITLLICAMGCKKVNEQYTDGFITVDVTTTYPKKELILQNLFDVEYISLETNNEFITAANIQAIGKDIIILKNTGRTDGDIFIFDRKGKGIRKINHLGQGAGEYTNILGLILDEVNEEIFLNNHYSAKVHVYDFFGNFKRSFKQKEDTFYDQIGVFDQNHLICHDGFSDDQELDAKRNFFMIVSKQNGSVRDILLPYKDLISTLIFKRDANGEIIDEWYIRNKRLIPYQDSWILIEPSADTIYRYTPDHRLEPFIVKIPSVQSVDPEIFLFPSVFTDRYYFMQALKKKYNFTTDTDVPKTNLIYDKKENAIFECVVYNDDFKDKVPVNLMFEMFKLTIVNNDEIAFAIKLEAFELVEAYKDGKLKGKLKEVTAGLDEESNPVIMLAKYKK